MDDLVEFLRARLDEDERAVEGTWTPPSSTPSHQLATMQGSIVMMRPARVLREVAAKRVLLDDYERFVAERRRMMGGWDSHPEVSPVLTAFAAVYDAHPDYRPEWAPTA
jgi:hypothetical protein